MHTTNFQSLLEKYLSDDITAEELKYFCESLQSGENDELLKERVLLALQSDQPAFVWEPDRQNAGWKEMTEHARMANMSVRSMWPRYAGLIAASLLILIAAGSWWIIYQHNKPATNSTVTEISYADIRPAATGAILTLSNGRQVVLDSVGNGVVANQQGVQTVLGNGMLSYSGASNNADVAETYNTIVTPKGRQFNIILPDGTHAWLNAASSIRFPVVFAAGKRSVIVTGEVYFEVAANASAFFEVHAGKSVTIRVLGTAFNISAYEDEKELHATLLNGKVSVQSAKQSVILIPGQKAVVGENIRLINDADTDKVMAWKNGAFDFNNLSLKEAMRQIQRWYDIEVVYEGDVPVDLPFSGRISRKMTLQHLLELLKGTALKFRLEGERKLIITK